jgi:hypothetical protein
MSDWRTLHTYFMALREEEQRIIQQHAPRFSLRAIGVYDGRAKYGRWELSHQVNENFEARVKLACADAARCLGCPPDAHPVDYWFHRLFAHLRDKRSRNLVEVDSDHWRIENLCESSATYCAVVEIERLHPEPRIIEQRAEEALPEAQDQRRPAPKELRDSYLAAFPEKIMILDICWAAKQRYREWTRWISGDLKDGSKPDRAFRAVLTSGKRPEQYRTELRPKGWK